MRLRRPAALVFATPVLGLMLLLVHMGRVACMPLPLVSLVPLTGSAIEQGETIPGSGGAAAPVLVGAYHIHTTESDGKGDVDAVARAAARANLDFVLVSDHDVEPKEPRVLHGVLVIPGVELSTSAGHVVAAGASRTSRWSLRQEDPIGAARHAGGVAIIAHPVNRRLPWSGSFEGVDGMEVINGDSLIREGMARPLTRFLPALATALGSRTIGSLSLQHRPDEAFELWDANPGLIGVCGHDAHGYEGYFGPFSAMQLRVRLDAPLPEDPAAAVSVFLRGLQTGDVFCTLGGLADPSGFDFQAGDDETIRASLRYESWPDSARSRVVLLRDGEEVAKGEREASLPAAPPGLYRAEVYLEVPWIWSRREFLWIFTSTLLVDGD